MRRTYPEIRIVKRFAVFPIEINCEERWWETVYIKQRRHRSSLSGGLFYADVEFVTEAKYLEYERERKENINGQK